MTAKPKPETLAAAIERIIAKRAFLLTAEAGNLSTPAWSLRNDLRQSEAGRKLAAWAKSPEGRKPFATITKSAGNAELLDLLAEWDRPPWRKL